MAHFTGDLEAELKRAIDRACLLGHARDVLDMINECYPEEQPDVQAMSDASKRLRDEEYGDWELAPAHGTTGAPKRAPRPSSSAPAGSGQMPVVPGRHGFLHGHPDMPEGITSLDQWGATVCELPKVRSKGASYR